MLKHILSVLLPSLGNLLQPVVWGGLERAEYTVGVEGCGQRKTYIVVCQLGSISCFAAAGQPY